MKELTKVVKINRAKWRSGQNGDLHTGKGEARLLNGEGFMCCLGFAAHQLGRINKGKMLDIVQPEDLDKVITPLSYKGVFICNTKFSEECITLNDDRKITRKQRERRLIRKFNAQGIDLKFHGEYPERT